MKVALRVIGTVAVLGWVVVIVVLSVIGLVSLVSS